MFGELPFRKSARAKWWDYDNSASYFITINIRDAHHVFGMIENERMVLSELGLLADRYWKEIDQHNKNIRVDLLQIMPNHLHGILWLNKCEGDLNTRSMHASTLHKTLKSQHHQISPPKESITTAIRSYKSAVSKDAKIYCPDFKWQRGFFDRIIRNSAEYEQIKEYILNIPKKWKSI